MSRRTREPGVYTTANGKYEVYYREGTRQRTKTFDRFEDAVDFRSQTRIARQRGETILRRKDVPTLNEAAAQYLERLEIKNRATSTLLWNASLLDSHILPYLGHLPMIDLTVDRLEDWQAQALKDGSTHYVLNRARGLLGAIFKMGIKRRWMVANPIPSVEVLEHRSRRGQTATVQQVEKMRQYFLDNDRLGYATLISVLAYNGNRPAEALALEWRHLQGRQLHVEQQAVDGELKYGTKTGVVRYSTLPSAVLADLAAWKLASSARDGLIFGREDGLPWRRFDYLNWRRRWFQPAAGAAGLLTWNPEAGKHGLWEGGFRVYDLRHTCASLKIRAGVPPAQVAAELGHSLAMLFGVYAHDLEAMRDQPVVPVDQAIASVRQNEVRSKLGEATA